MDGDGAAEAWDQHSQPEKNLAKLANQVDLPTAGLLQDLKQRRLLEDNIIVFATELEELWALREQVDAIITSIASAIWMAGGGSKIGLVHG